MGGRKFFAVLGVFILLAGACSSGSGGDASDIGPAPPPGNQAPIAAFSITPEVGIEGTTFQFNAMACFDNEDPIADLEVRWKINDVWTVFSTNKQISQVYNTGGTHTVRVQVRDTGGKTDSTTNQLEVISSTSPRISGNITFEKVPVNPCPNIPPPPPCGLDLINTTFEPARRIVVQAVRPSDGVTVGEDITDDAGNYSVQAPENTDVYIRVVARMDDGLARVEVMPPGNDNVYAARGPDIALGTIDITGEDYWIPDDPGRVSGPFNMLDVILKAYIIVRAENPGDVSPPLKVRWAAGNTDGTYYCPAEYANCNGEDQIYILGVRNSDSDEFDDHVVAHEYGHFIAAQLYRDDSIGGSHTFTDVLDVRVAYSEGFANAFSAMVLGDPLYIDSLYYQGNQVAWDINMEDNGEAGVGDTNEGYNNEASVYAIFWDLYDNTPAEPAYKTYTDAVNYTYGTLNTTLTNTNLNTTADLMYIYPFADKLKSLRPVGERAAIDDVLAMENILYPENVAQTFTDLNFPATDPDTRTNVDINGGAGNDTTDGYPWGSNKFVANHFYRFTIGTLTNVRIQTTCTSDIDIFLYKKGEWIAQKRTTNGNETIDISLPAETYVVNVQAWQAGTYQYDISVSTLP